MRWTTVRLLVATTCAIAEQRQKSGKTHHSAHETHTKTTAQHTLFFVLVSHALRFKYDCFFGNFTRRQRVYPSALQTLALARLSTYPLPFLWTQRQRPAAIRVLPSARSNAWPPDVDTDSRAEPNASRYGTLPSTAQNDQRPFQKRFAFDPSPGQLHSPVAHVCQDSNSS